MSQFSDTGTAPAPPLVSPVSSSWPYSSSSPACPWTTSEPLLRPMALSRLAIRRIDAVLIDGRHRIAEHVPVVLHLPVAGWQRRDRPDQRRVVSEDGVVVVTAIQEVAAVTNAGEPRPAEQVVLLGVAEHPVDSEVAFHVVVAVVAVHRVVAALAPHDVVVAVAEHGVVAVDTRVDRGADPNSMSSMTDRALDAVVERVDLPVARGQRGEWPLDDGVVAGHDVVVVATVATRGGHLVGAVHQVVAVETAVAASGRVLVDPAGAADHVVLVGVALHDVVAGVAFHVVVAVVAVHDVGAALAVHDVVVRVARHRVATAHIAGDVRVGHRGDVDATALVRVGCRR